MEVDIDHISIFTDDHGGEIDAALRKGLLVNRDSRTVGILGRNGILPSREAAAFS